MSHVKLLLYRGRELDIVSQAEAVEPLSPMLSSLDRASQGLAALEAVDQLSLEREANPQLYKMLVGVLRTIAATPSPLNVPAFYWKLLAREGFHPELDACVRCRESEPDVSVGRVRPQRGRGAVSIVPLGAGDQPRSTRRSCATFSAVASSTPSIRTNRRRRTRCHRWPRRRWSSRSNDASRQSRCSRPTSGRQLTPTRYRSHVWLMRRVG